MRTEGEGRLDQIRAALKGIKPLFLDKRLTRADRGTLLVVMTDDMRDRAEFTPRQAAELESIFTDYLGEEVPGQGGNNGS